MTKTFINKPYKISNCYQKGKQCILHVEIQFKISKHIRDFTSKNSQVGTGHIKSYSVFSWVNVLALTEPLGQVQPYMIISVW